ncbi:MAG: hypothetical protein ABJC26_10235 [Gemmatimonadaceae bacterium]
MTVSCRFASLIGLFLLLASTGCKEQPSPAPATIAAPAATASDSQYTTAAMIARFRKNVPAHPAKMGDGATNNRDSLVAHYVHALAANDKPAFAAMRINVSEYAWLYYLDMPQSKPPYELDPDILWMQLNAQSDKGLGRLSDRIKARPFGFKRYSCDAPQKLETVTLHRCQMVGADLTVRFSIIERDGLFKFTSYANDL